ncbi:phosphotransferase [Streptomyces sp. GbtcB6]|uniref:phosphotransferase enzyme family protein n=1 Tax=Streptomyces sp. GbtcB6 TaxID=2824751 RepID=UPI001C30D7F3|nr:phosphotransferase [Streptomyces sp. GbtcB6]
MNGQTASHRGGDDAAQSEFVHAALLHSFGARATSVMRVRAGTDTVNHRAILDDERQVFVKIMRPGQAEAEVRAATHLACFTRSGGLPVPRFWLGRDSMPFARHGGRLITVQDYIDGIPASSQPLTIALAEEIGSVIGRLHRQLAAYPGALPVLSARWWTDAGQQRFDNDYQRLRDVLADHEGTATAAHAQMLEERRQDLLAHADSLRKGFPADPVRQPLHADLTTPNVLLSPAGRVAAVIDFYARTGPAAWEVGRIALDPRTVASESDWVPVALAMITAYREENPYLPREDLVACIRMALLHALHSLFGLYEHYVEPSTYDVGDVLRYWEQRHVMTRRVLPQLGLLEDEIRAAAGAR